MKRLAALLYLVLAASAQAQVTKCTDPKTGAVSYTDGKCSNGQKGGAVSTTSNTVQAVQVPQDEEPQRQPAMAGSIGAERRQVASAAPAPVPASAKSRAPDLIASCNDTGAVVVCTSADGKESYNGRGTSYMRVSDGKMCTSVMTRQGGAMSCS